ncbi:unnamed protein product [Cyprideis torosa]|uniref:Uncharacterized protein n=1 Tax=Cyprideis torosa TaxID=163714 RepID=A0A7R8WBS9_9CRUS|nr:unnamed protein product [Cyprideis torosa]CAG0886784.1 unnamed protein product [Cyprideis torosa]
MYRYTMQKNNPTSPHEYSTKTECIESCIKINSLGGIPSKGEVYEEVDRCFQSLSIRLGHEKYFFDKPTELDALLFGHLFTILTTELPDPKLMGRFPVARDHPMGAMRVLVLSSDYGYVALVGAASAMMTYWQVSQVVHKRHKAGVAYPKMYEEGANEFNCAQRGHQNTLENYPQFLITLFLGGLEYPRVSASLGVLWILGRIGFMLGYCSGVSRLYIGEDCEESTNMSPPVLDSQERQVTFNRETAEFNSNNSSAKLKRLKFFKSTFECFTYKLNSPPL